MSSREKKNGTSGSPAGLGSFDDFSLLARLVSDGVAVVDAKGRLLWANPAFLRMSGHDGPLPEGMDLYALSGPETNMDTLLDISLRMREGKAAEQEILRYRQDGSSYWVSSSVTPLPREAGESPLFVVVERDITQKKAEEKQKDEFMFALYRILCEGDRA